MNKYLLFKNRIMSHNPRKRQYIHPYINNEDKTTESNKKEKREKDPDLFL